MKQIFSNLMGMLPVVEDHLLPENYASQTLNCRKEGASLVPIKEPVDTGASIANSVNTWVKYHFNKSQVITRADSGDVVRGPIANDAYDRVYSAGSANTPKVHYLDGSLQTVDLGIKVPGKPVPDGQWPTAEPPTPDYIAFNATYVLTNVTGIGEESAPSFPSVVITRWDDANVGLTLPASNDSRAVKRRIYRSDGGGVYQLVVELNASVTDYTDDTDSVDLGYELVSENFDEPSDNLQGFINAGNGFMGSWFENNVCFCEPNYPHAWPIDYRYALPSQVVGMASVSGGVIVTTDSYPYIFQGTHPVAMTPTKVDKPYPGLSRFGVVDMGEYALYPSNEGLVAISGGGVDVVTKNVLSKDQWAALNPDTFVAFRYRGMYLAFSSAGAFLFDQESGYWPIELTGTASDQVVNGYYDAEDDTLYLLVKHSNNTRTAYTFDAGANKTIEWTSREFIKGPGVLFSAGRVDATADATVTITGTHRGTQTYSFSKTAGDDAGFMLGPGRYSRFRVKASTAGALNVVSLASSRQEL